MMTTYRVKLTAELTAVLVVEAKNKYHAEQISKEDLTDEIGLLDAGLPVGDSISISRPNASATLVESEE